MEGSVARKAHNIEIGITQLGYISELLDDVAFGVNTTLGVSRSPTPRAIVIRSLGENLSAFHNNGHMDVGVVAITELGRARIIQKLLKNPILAKMRHVMPFTIASRFHNFNLLCQI
jgi:hypothetical protein